MIAPTHVAFALACGSLAGAAPWGLKLMAAGALLPDIDHPQSTIGRLFFFVSMPLNKLFGHRQTIHGFALWGAIATIGIVWPPALWLGLGAISHIFLDAWNVSGVQALMPFSEKVCVLFGRKWRFLAGSKNELILLVVLTSITWGGSYISSMGGFKALLGTLTRSYRIAYQEYLGQGLAICDLEGKLRHQNGKIEHGTWRIIGKDQDHGLAILYGDEILRIPAQAEFLRARLKVTGEKWESARITGWARTRQDAFFYDGEQWKQAPAGCIVFGQVIGKQIEIEVLGL